MRVAIITESFLPDVNGVANSVVRVAENLVAAGHSPLVIAPQPATDKARIAPALPYPLVRIPSVGMPGYPGFRLGLPGRLIERTLADHATDVVHLASPFILGAWGAKAATRLRIPIVAVYQTDVPGYARYYRLGQGEKTAWKWVKRVHGRAGRTLAPSTATAEQLLAHGIGDVWLWRRGVDTELFNPGRRDEGLRASLAPAGNVIVGYVGRLAGEKRVDLLAPTLRRPGVTVVIVGDGPDRARLEKELPGAVFLGEKHGVELAQLHASFDIFAHTGPLETFGQAIQEAQASGVPVVAPAAGGPLDLVDPDRTGYLVPPYDGDAIAAAVARLVDDPALRAGFGQHACQTVGGRTWGSVTAELIDHYHAVLGRPPVRVVTGRAVAVTERVGPIGVQ